MGEITIQTDKSFEVVCNECNSKLEAAVYQDIELVIEPCEKCLEDARKEGKEEGFEEGKREWWKERYGGA